MLEEEIGTAMQIQSIQWHWVWTPDAEEFATCGDFNLYMGYCDSDELGSGFEDNYVPGTRTLVYSNPSLYVTAGAGGWTPVNLSTPFWYDGSGNLIIEVEWANDFDDNSFYCGQWNTGSTRCLKVEDNGPAQLDSNVTHMILTGVLGLDTGSFGEIKTCVSI
ncbi:hypothetical protein JW921_07350 [Candidatus Fermentibacterales bacterium]|nr:hypothetical protein [Candidatus Fermentibacterales bacterium]